MLGILALIVLVLVVIWVVKFGISALISIIAWALAGWIASRLMGGDGAGLIGNILLGIIGGFVGSFVLNLIGLNDVVSNIWLVGNILVGVVGAVIVIFIVRTTTGNRLFGS